MTVSRTTKTKVRAALVRLNDLYGKGKLFAVDWKNMQVVIRIWVTQHSFGPPERYRFQFDGKTVRFRSHQQGI
jgi:hypothetical protein